MIIIYINIKYYKFCTCKTVIVEKFINPDWLIFCSGIKYPPLNINFNLSVMPVFCKYISIASLTNFSGLILTLIVCPYNLFSKHKFHFSKFSLGILKFNHIILHCIHRHWQIHSLHIHHIIHSHI